MELVTQGLQNKTIAARLSITHTTVRHHLTSIFEKLSVTNRLELMRYAYDEQRSSDIVRR
jgi:DNA-binding NarL/FixJ family response regulator